MVIVCGLFFGIGIQSQEVSERPTYEAIRLGKAPTLDGDIGNDPAWASVQPVSGFVQNLPNPGEPASMATHVFVGYTDEALHIGFICFEDDVNDMHVSGNGWESDSMVVVLDTYQDEVNGYAFSTNQAGAEWDSSIFNGNTDWNWSTVWFAKSQINDDSWSSELVIPFTSINYPTQRVQDWKINFSRYIHNRNEISAWAPIPRQFSVWRLSLAGTLKGIQPPPPKRNIKFMPYALTYDAETARRRNENQQDWGFDVRYSLTPTLNLDATYNTDFAQVESDSLQINQGRFSLFFPETRPFFLENAQLFNIGVPRETLLFHSRTIGVARDGTRLPIDGGIKVTGTVAQRNRVGFIHMRADSAFTDASEDFTIARYSRDLPGRSAVGLLTTHRKNGENSYQTIGGDLQWGIGDHGEIRTFVATTDSDDGFAREDEYAYAAFGSYNSPKWQSSASYHEVGSGFNPAVGFAQRRGTRKWHVLGQRVISIEGKSGLNEFLPLLAYTEYRGFDGFKESGYFQADSYLYWKNGANVSTSYSINDEGLRTPFRFLGEEIPARSYSSPVVGIGVNSPQNANWALGATLNTGEFYHGDNHALGIFASYTPNEFLNIQLNHNQNRVEFPTRTSPDSFSLSRMGIRISFTPKLRLSTLLQYNSADDILAINARFSWLRRANSGFYLVFNEFEEQNNMGTESRRTVVVKYSHLFDINL